MNWLFYLLEANLYLTVFFAFYKLFLYKETFYSLNRYFLIFSSVLAFLLPLVKISSLNPPLNAMPDTFQAASVADESNLTIEGLVMILYLLIVLLGFGRLMFRLAHIYRLIKSAKTEKIGKIHLVQFNGSQPFSFFSYLFMDPDCRNKETILRHEKVHIEQLHSADILFFELLRIINWFNPIVILIRQEIKAIHEFLADEQASKGKLAPDEYALFLIQNSRINITKPLINQMFNQSLLKKRIIMLSKKKSVPASRLKYGLLTLIIPAMVCGSSFALTKSYGIDLAIPGLAHQDSTPVKKKRVPPPPPAKQPETAKVKFPKPHLKADKSSNQPVAIPDKNGKIPPPPPPKLTAGKVKFPKPRLTETDKSPNRPVAIPDKNGKVPPPPPPKPATGKVKFPKPRLIEADKSPNRPVAIPDKDGKVPPPPPPAEPGTEK